MGNFMGLNLQISVLYIVVFSSKSHVLITFVILQNTRIVQKIWVNI